MAEKLAENYEKGKNSQPLLRFKNSDLRLMGGGVQAFIIATPLGLVSFYTGCDP